MTRRPHSITPPVWLLLLMLLLTLVLVVATLLDLTPDLILSPTVSLVELFWSLSSLSAASFTGTNTIEASVDTARVDADPSSETFIYDAVIVDKNQRFEGYLLVVSLFNLGLGILAMLTPPAVRESGQVAGSIFTGAFIDLNMYTLWVAVRNRHDRRFLAGEPFWPRRGGPLDVWVRNKMGLPK